MSGRLLLLSRSVEIRDCQEMALVEPGGIHSLGVLSYTPQERSARLLKSARIHSIGAPPPATITPPR